MKTIPADILPFIPTSQKYALLEAMRGEESQFFVEIFKELSQTIKTMPVSYQTDGQGDNAIVYLHFFIGSMDAYITELDVSGAPFNQCFGYADFGYGGELGYISIQEWVDQGAELDLHWEPKSLRDVKAEGN